MQKYRIKFAILFGLYSSKVHDARRAQYIDVAVNKFHTNSKNTIQ